VLSSLAACGDDDATPPELGSATASESSSTERVPSTTVAATDGPAATATTGSSVVDGAGRTFRPSDDGATVRLPIDATAELLLPSAAAAPTVEGDAVSLIALASFTDSGDREYEIRATAPGSARIVGTDPAFVLTFVVDG